MIRKTWLYGFLIVVMVVWIHCPSTTLALSPDDYFKVKVVDAETGRGVPLVKLETVNNIVYYTDSAGVAAIFEPGLMNKEVWFSVDSQGYTFNGPAPRGGIQLELTPGESRTIKIQSQNIARRLYRITGFGIYHDSFLVKRENRFNHPIINRIFMDRKIPIDDPVLNTGKISGQDSVRNAVFHNKIYWFWNDTVRIIGDNNRFGIARGTGATSTLPSEHGLDPTQGVNLDYFAGEDGEASNVFHRSIAPWVWFNNLMVIKSASDKEQMFSSYFTVRKSRRGIAKWNGQKKKFKNVIKFPKNQKIQLIGRTFKVRKKGREWFYFANPYPVIRVPATQETITNPDRYQTFTPFEQGSRFPKGSIERDTDGNPVWTWKTHTSSLNNRRDRARLNRMDKLDSSESIFHLRAFNEENSIDGNGTVYWNEYRQKWIMIIGEVFGKFSLLGDLWYAEADSPIGPWVYAQRIVRHENYSCYGAKQDKMFDQFHGRRIFLECTYSEAFSSGSATPRYNYNQIMYQLDLADPRLNLPSPVYHYRDRHGTHHYHTLKGLSPARSQQKFLSGLKKWFNQERQERGRFRFRFTPPEEKHRPTEEFKLDSNVKSDSIARNAPIPFYALPPDRPRRGTLPVWETRGREGAVKLTLGQSHFGFDFGRVTSLSFFAYPPDAEVDNPNLVDVYEFKHRSRNRYVYSPSDPGPDWSRTKLAFQAWKSPNTDPPRAPGAEPVKTCMGTSADCDSRHDFHPFE